MARRPRVYLEATPLINKHLSGIGHVVLETLRALDTKEFEDYDIRAFVPWDEYEKLRSYGFKRIKTVRLPYPHKVFSLFSRLPIAPPLDIFLGRGVYVFFNFRNWNLARSPSLTYVHDVCFMRYPEFVQPRNLQYLRKYTPLWLSRTTRVIAVSDFSRYEITEYLGVPTLRTATIRNTVDTAAFVSVSDASIAEVRQRYGLTHSYLLFVGNIEPRKNLLTLINAFTLSKQASEATLLIIGGEGWLNGTVITAIDTAKEKGYDIRRNDSFVSDQDVAALMKGARALVLPSWHEGFGLPALEALTAGTPVIASDIPGLREAVTGYEDGVTFFDPADEGELSRIIDTTVISVKPPVAARHGRSWTDAARDLTAIIDTIRSRK